MPQKKAKKAAKPDKSKKSAKPAAKAAKSAGLGAALKKAAKDIGKKIGGLNGPKKAAASHPAKKVAAPAKAEKPGKKMAAPAPAPAAAAKGKKGAPALTLVKGKKEAAPAAKPGKPGAPAKGKKGEVVVVVPAAKGAAVIAKDGKKKGKAAAEGSLAKKNRCREPGCDHDFSLQGYCRLHYIKNWRRIKRKESILASGQLNNYVEELVSKYPDKYLDVIRQDLSSEKEWSKAVVDLELDGTDDDAGTEEDIDAAAEGVRPAAGAAPRGGEFDDEGDAF